MVNSTVYAGEDTEAFVVKLRNEINKLWMNAAREDNFLH